MSQDNQAAQNPQQDERQHTARKSAASAKPATQAASSVYVPKKAASKRAKPNPFQKLKDKATEQPKPKTKAEKRAAQEAQEQRIFAEGAARHKPDTPTYKRLRFLFWASIILAIAFTLYSLFLTNTQGPSAGRVWFGVGSLLVALSIYIDTSKVRQEREADYQRLLDEQAASGKARRASGVDAANAEGGTGKPQGPLG